MCVVLRDSKPTCDVGVSLCATQKPHLALITHQQQPPPNTALLILFALAVGLSRLDLAISRDAKYMARLEHEKLVDIAQRLDATLTQRRSVLRDLDVAAATKPVAECAEARTAAEASFKASDAQVRALLEELKGLGGSREADRFVKVVEEERALVQSSLALFVKKVDLVKQGAKAAVCGCVFVICAQHAYLVYVHV